MPSYNNFQSKNKKNIKDRYDIYESEFYSPIEKSSDSKLDLHLHKWVEFIAFMRWYPDIYFDMIKPETGGITLDSYQRLMMRTLVRFPQNYFCAPRGIAKCVTGDTMLFTSNGMKEIGEYFNYINDNIEFEQLHNISVLNKNGKMETSLAGVYSGYKETKKIMTDFGYEIEASLNHPILIMTKNGDLEYKKTEDICVGDYLPISRKNDVWGSNTYIDYNFDKFLDTKSEISKSRLKNKNIHKFPTELTPDFSLILGYLIGDGCMTRDNTIQFTNEDKDILNNYISFFKNVLNANVKQKDDINFTTHGMLLREYFNQIGLKEVNAFGKEIPKLILESTKENVANFIKGLFDTDGCVAGNSIQYCTASEKLSKQVQLVLLNFGIISSRKKCYNKKFKTYHYKICISSNNIDIYNKEIGFSCERKQNKLNKYCKENHDKRNPNKDIIPYQSNKIIKLYPKGHTRDKFYHVLKGNNELTYNKLSLLFDVNERFDNKDFEEYEQLKQIYNLNYYYTKVVEIESSANHVYDLNMPETNSFIGNGFINHNTLIEVMVLYHTAMWYPNITLAITASTKESAAKIWKEKHDEIIRFYPSIANEIKSANFSKDTGRVEFQNGAVIDNLANAQSSKGLRRRRGSLEESALIDKDLYEDAIEPIFNVPRVTLGNIVDPTELNGAINRFTTSGYKNSDEYEVILKTVRQMNALEGSFVFGADWRVPIHFGRQKKSTIDKARQGNTIRFQQNYLCKWIGVSDGGLINISKLIKQRTLSSPEFEIPKDKRGNNELAEYVISVDVARSASDSNNKTAIVVLKIKRNGKGTVSQVRIVNIITPPNGLNFTEQTVEVKRVFYQYGGNLDLTKSRVKAIVVDANTIGQGLIDRLLEEITDPVTNEELGCFATINTNQRPETPSSPPIVYALKSQGINGEIIKTFIDYVESNKLKLVMSFDNIKENMPKGVDKILLEQTCFQYQKLIDEVSNLKLKKTQNSITVEQVIKRVDKDRYSATAYGLYYIELFMNNYEDVDYDDEDELVYY